MNPLCELLGTDDILLDVDVKNKDELLQRVSELLARRHGLSSVFVLESLRAREALGSTAVGHGVALPHARIGTIPSALALFLRTKTPIAFDAPDGKPVSNVLALLVPRQASERHLQLLAGAATLLSDPNFRAELSQCKSAGAVRWLFACAPDSPGGGSASGNA